MVMIASHRELYNESRDTKREFVEAFEKKIKNKRVKDFRDTIIEKIGKKAEIIRKHFEDKGIINENTTFINKEALENIINNFGQAMAHLYENDDYKNIKGNLKEFEDGITPYGLSEYSTDIIIKDPYFIQKTSKYTFEIYFENDKHGEFPYLSILHALGHVALDWGNMIKRVKLEKGVSNRRYCKGIGFDYRDALVFARAFAMPEKHFREIAASNSNKYDRIYFAEIYRIYSSEVVLRGIELDIWR